MASRPSPSFEESFDALIKYLQKAIKAQKLISIPEEIEKPFRAVSHPSDVSLLRKLLKLFDGKQQHHVLQLAPKSFCGIVFIALHFPYSTTQDKLLHTFMNALRLYRDDSAAILCLQKCGLNNIKKAQVQADRQAISQRLLHTLLKRYVGGGIEKKLRWTMAQVLSTLIYNDSSARRRLTSFPEIKHLSTLLQDLDDYVGRFLVSNLLRHLVHHGTDPAIFWPQGTPDQLILSFPAAEQSSVEWLAELHRFFADLDTTLAFGAGRQCVLPVLELVCSRGANARADSNAIVVVSDGLTFVMASNDDMLRIRSFPIFQTSDMAASSDSTENEVRMTYLKDNGFELVNGSKSAINSISLRFENKSDARIVHDMILEGQKDAGHADDEEGVVKTDTSAVTPEPKRSIALVNLWSPERQQSTARPLSHVERGRDSDTQDASPLQHRSQPLSQTHTVRPRGNQGHGGLDSETASETSFLEAAQDRQALPERLQASQSSSVNVQDLSNFNARVDDAVARHKSTKSDPKTLAPEPLPRKAGTTTSSPHLPRDAAQRPQKSNTSKQGLLLNGNKSRSSNDVRRSTALIGTVAVSPVSPVVEPPASLKSKKASMAKLASGPPPATSTLKKSTKTPGGPAARLAGSQPPSQQQTSKSASSTGDALKRKSLPSNKDKPPKTTDWDQDLRDDSQFDIPDDPSDEERPTKRARKGGKQPTRKPAVKSRKAPETKKIQASKDSKRPPGGPKKTNTEQPPEKSKPTVASTRERRPHKSTKYVEESESEAEEEEHPGAEARSASEEASSPIKDTAPQSLMVPTAPKKTGIQRRLHSQNLNVPKAISRKAEQMPLSVQTEPASNADQNTHRKTSAQQSDPEDASRKSPPKTSAPAPGATAMKQKAVAPARQSPDLDQPDLDDDVLEEEAQDSYPMDRARRDAAAAAARDSFGTHLQTELQEVGLADDTDQQDKENVPPAPQTPFGNKKTFVANVNAARSALTKKGPVSQVSKSPESHTPRSTRKSAKNAKGTAAISAPLGHFAPALAAIRGKEQTNEKTSQVVVEGEDEVVPAESLQNDPIVLADDEVHEGPTALPEQHAMREDRVAPITVAEVSSDTRGLEAIVREPSEKTEESIGVQPNDTPQPGIADFAPMAKAPKHRESSGARTVVNGSLQVPPKKKKASAETTNPEEAREKRSSDMGAGLKAMIDASNTGTPPLASGMGKPRARISSNAAAGETMIATEQKEVVRTSTSLEAREVQTPRREVEELAGMLTSEKVTKKPSVVRFGAHGPENQGVPARTEAHRSSEVLLPPPETERHHEAKQWAKEHLSEDTPSHEPVPLTDRSAFIPDVNESHDAGEEGIIVVDDVELESTRSIVGSDHGPEAREEPRRNERPASTSQPLIAQSEIVDASSGPDLVNHAGPDETSLDASVQDPSSSESEEDEASEYEGEQDSVDDSGETGGSRDEEPEVDEEVAGDSHAPQSPNISPTRVTLIDKVVKEPGAVHRESIGLSLLLRESNPKAKDNITTKAFRPSHEQAHETNIDHISTPAEHVTRERTTKAIKQRAEDDGSLMPPPKSRPRHSAGEDIGHNAIKIIPVRRGSLDSDANADRTANPLAQLPSASVSIAVKLMPEDQDGEKTGKRVATAPMRVKRPCKSDRSPEPALPIGTPITFHAKLAETSTHADEAGDRRKTGSYMSEDTADATLVNGNSMSNIFHLPAHRESRYERQMTETTDESPPPSSMGGSHVEWAERKVWEQAIRPPHWSLYQNVMQIANGMLFRLGEEEDAIRAKVDEFARGGNTFLHELEESWNKRVVHEKSKIVQSSSAGRDGLAVKLDQLGKDGKGATQEWKKIQRVKDVAEMVDAREQEVLSGLEMLSIGVDA